MELAISTLFNYNIPFGEMLSILSKYGFRFISLGPDRNHSGYYTKNGLKRLKDSLKENNLKVISIHSPLDKTLDLCSTSDGTRLLALEAVITAIDSASELGKANVVIHPANNPSDEKVNEQWNKLKYELLEISRYASNKKINLCVENTLVDDGLELFIRIMDSPMYSNIGWCLDSSHLTISGDMISFIEKYGHRIVDVHLSDTNAKDDHHLLPFQGKIDWEKLFHLIKKKKSIEFIHLEVMMSKSGFENPVEFVKEAYDRGNKLIELWKKA